MSDKEIPKTEIEPIALIHTDFPEKFGIPRQSGLVKEAGGCVELLPKYRHPDALRGLKEYDYVWLLWDFSQNHRKGWSATVTPPRLGGRERVGVFASRSPFRPNSIGLSCVRLEGVDEENGRIFLSGVDLLDGTPIYDIKPYLPYADAHPGARGGFADGTMEHALKVCIPAKLEAMLPADTAAAIRGILEQDPRTAFIHDEERVWGVAYGGYNVRFTVSGDELTVREIQRKGRETMKADAIILDVDGTLWDSTPIVAKAWTEVLQQAGLDRKVESSELKSLFGKPMNIIADELLPEIPEETRYPLMEKCMKLEEEFLEKNESDISYPGVADSIRRLSERIPVCIVSNCQSGYIELVMEKLGITEQIADTECYGDTGLYKAENLRLLTQRNGYSAAVYVGDIQGDQDAAHEAGLPFIHAAYGFGTADAPEAVIAAFAELETLIEKC